MLLCIETEVLTCAAEVWEATFLDSERVDSFQQLHLTINVREDLPRSRANVI